MFILKTSFFPVCQRLFFLINKTSLFIGLLISFLFSSQFFFLQSTQAFCGFYVSQKTGAEIYNTASQVILAREEKKTVISMFNNFKGAPQEFAMVIPVPVLLQQEDIRVINPSLFARIDTFTSPRLVEYYDPHPCMRSRIVYMESAESTRATGSSSRQGSPSLGVTVEARYTVGEYDIVILSGENSQGLETWLISHGYNIPEGASEALQPYISQGMYFFVAKVDLGKHESLGLDYLRPLQFSFETEGFGLPIRLGMLNAEGEQELFIYILSEKGRVEVRNYANQKLPSDKEVPRFVKESEEFEKFYRALVDHQLEKTKEQPTVLTEYFWDMSWCDPCPSNPLSPEELQKVGVFWLKDVQQGNSGADSWSNRNVNTNVQVTRLHLRYSKDSFKEDLQFAETGDQENFQARYIVRHPWPGDSYPRQDPSSFPSPPPLAEREHFSYNGYNCKKEIQTYFRSLLGRQEEQVQNLAELTGWDSSFIWKKIADRHQRFSLSRFPSYLPPRQPSPRSQSWWEWLRDWW